MIQLTQKSFDPHEKSLERLCVHTATTKPWSIEEAIFEYASRGIGGISIWRDAVENKNLKTIRTMLKDHNLEPVSLVRGGFFPSLEESSRKGAILENIQAMHEAAELGCPQLVLVCGADPKLNVKDNLSYIRDGIAALLETSHQLDVKLSIEPLHPMYADQRSAINLMSTANEICNELSDENLGLAVDVFHVWWDPNLEDELKHTAIQERFFAYHLCDWKLNMNDMLNDRGLMGEGVIPLSEITKQVSDLGFCGYHEVEIFSQHWWSKDQGEFLDQIVDRYLKIC
jgi:sugar phosphate isomerase/epimerase